jgi:SWI/SNF-related matrix-associated actin-dependent regulator 1 of chromatin subfamily A
VKLITRGTIEEDMLKLGRTKLALDEAVAGDGDDVDGKVREAEVRQSLLNSLREKLVLEVEPDQDSTGAQTPG